MKKIIEKIKEWMEVEGEEGFDVVNSGGGLIDKWKNEKEFERWLIEKRKNFDDDIDFLRGLYERWELYSVFNFVEWVKELGLKIKVN